MSWHKEPRRHSLARRGVKTATKNTQDRVMKKDLETKFSKQKSFGGKAEIVTEGDIETLKSYGLNVATYNKKTGDIKVNGWYSNTTARHINEFLAEKGISGTLSKKELQEKPLIKEGKINKTEPKEKPKKDEKISLKKKWVSTSAWRGYEEPINAFAGYNDTGNWEDSPYPSSSGEESRKRFSKFLKEEGIPFKTTTGKTSNVFAVNHFFVTTPSNVEKAKKLVAKYEKLSNDDRIWVN